MPEPGDYLDHDWYGVPVPQNVRFGSDAWIYSTYAFSHCRSKRNPAITVGRSTGLYNGTHFELGPKGRVSVGDFTTVNGAIIATNGDVQIGSHVLISWNVTLAEHAFALPPAEYTGQHQRPHSKPIVIGDDCWIGTQAVLLGGARLGSNVIVGAATVVDFEVPDNSIVAGNPAKITAIRGLAHQ